MKADDKIKARRLIELLFGRSGRKEQSKVDRADSFEEFRVMLVRDCADNDAISAVVERWRARVAALLTETDDRQLMHDLELLSIKQMEIEKLLKTNEASLMSKLHAVDASAKELADLSAQVREVRVAIGEYRRRISELAIRKVTLESENDLTRASN